MVGFKDLSEVVYIIVGSILSKLLIIKSDVNVAPGGLGPDSS
jgi:hypothetical protein